jgi:hypothetical protein
VNRKAKDKLGYWRKKYRNMRAAKALRPQSLRSRELREEETWKLGAGPEQLPACQPPGAGA